jgi:two-component sensor histidine kinase
MAPTTTANAKPPHRADPPALKLGRGPDVPNRSWFGESDRPAEQPMSPPNVTDAHAARSIQNVVPLSIVPKLSATIAPGSGPRRSLHASRRTGLQDSVAKYRKEILVRLLEPISPAAWGGQQVLWPLWADEMVHRTCVTAQLTALLMSALRTERDVPIGLELDYRIASGLTASIRELVILNDNERLPCSVLLRSVTRNFVELFGQVAGNITVLITVEPLLLAAFKRRALILVAVELISQALIHGLSGPAQGRLEVALTRPNPSCARLVVGHNGTSRRPPVRLGCQQIEHDLANLLEAEIVYEVAGPGSMATVIDFPV